MIAIETLFTPGNAMKVAAENNHYEEEDWTYEVVDDPTGKGYSFIEIYDEDGEFVGKV